MPLLFQFYVTTGVSPASCISAAADVFLGVPFNIASYACSPHGGAGADLKPGEFVHTVGDAHIYRNHFDQADEQLKRIPRALPRMQIDPAVKSIFKFKFEHFKLAGYDPHPHIAAPVAV